MAFSFASIHRVNFEFLCRHFPSWLTTLKGKTKLVAYKFAMCLGHKLLDFSLLHESTSTLIEGKFKKCNELNIYFPYSE